MAAITVLGLDGCRGGWACVALTDGQVAATFGATTIEAASGRFPEAAAIGIDMPFALPASGRRPADAAAKAFLGSRGASVFLMPAEPLLEARTHHEAIALARSLNELAPSAQCFALFNKVREARAALGAGLPLYEVHPEVSFQALGGAALPRKKSWNGQRARLRLLAAAGIHLEECEADDIPPEDVIDAAVAAWSATRIARGEALTLPETPAAAEREARMLVWY